MFFFFFSVSGEFNDSDNLRFDKNMVGELNVWIDKC